MLWQVIFTTPTQPQLNSKIGFDMKMTFHHHHPPPQTQCRQYPDFNETLKVDSWEHPEQIPTIKLTFVQTTFVLGTFVIYKISQMLLTRC